MFYDKSTGKTFIPKYDSKFALQGMVNDLDGGAPFTPEFIVENNMYAFIDAIDFIEYASVSESADMKSVAAQLTDESNPVLVKVTTK